jgi:hypothetical protein
MTNPTPVTAVDVTVHFGAEHATFNTSVSSSLSAIVQIALERLRIPTDPGLEYFLSAAGQDYHDGSLTLAGLFGNRPLTHVTFHLKKRPTGGAVQ